MTDEQARHPSVVHMIKMLEPNPNLPTPLHDIADNIYGLALRLVDYHGLEGQETAVGLRKLLEAKDCFVRAKVFESR